jgi:hypothetical protein
VLLGLLVLGVGSANASTTAPKSFFGIVPQTPLDAGDYQVVDESNAGTVRLILSWPAVQPDSTTTNWSGFDHQVEMASQQGIRVLPFIYNSPDWIGGCSSDCSTHAPSTPQALGHWKKFVAAAEDRYGPGGEFWSAHPGLPKLPIRAWQIWNEQNSKTFFTPKPDPKLYEKMLSRAADAIYSRDRKANVILGGMFGTPAGGGGKAIAAADYLDRLYKIRGAKNDFDGIALHPYSRGVDFVERQVKIARRALKRAHDSSTDLWITEIGWASGGKPSSLNVGSQKAQADRLKEAYSLFEKNRKAWNVRLVAWFSFQDSPASDSFCFFCAKSGLLTEDGKKKASYLAFKRIAGRR